MGVVLDNASLIAISQEWGSVINERLWNSAAAPYALIRPSYRVILTGAIDRTHAPE